ncbi:MAG: M48 family metallopeptidase, partial [Gammaproteobacteria bacterium]
PYHDEPTRYLQKLGERLVRTFGATQRWPGHLDWPSQGWRFALVRNHSVNAFSIGDGRIYVTDGAFGFVRSEAELAAILAHEISHQLSGHFCRPSPDLNSHRRELGSLIQIVDYRLEMEADDLALNILLLAGFRPASLSEVVRRLPIAGNDAQHRSRIKTLNKKLRGMGSLPETSSSGEFKRIRKYLSGPRP